MADLDKTYDPATVEGRWYEFWIGQGYFHGDENAPGPRFSVVIPPPNVTGSLTMGHVLNNTLQDVLVRYRRMRGDVTLWMPGTDHAGIATQNVVEREIAKEGLDRHDLGRDKFLDRVWAWKEQYGSRIMLQLRRLGSSLDWPRERFTMDPGLSRAVREVFVRLHEKGLIYRGHRIIHWCPRCLTALSDEEAIVSEGGETGSLWHIRYPAEDGSEGLVVATTRPETMLGDTGVAVNPTDERYAPLVGRRVVLPLMDRAIPVVADELVDPSFGTGAVKVTPAHDANDYEMAQRHELPTLTIMTPAGIITEAGGGYAGLDRFDARKRVVADLEEKGLLVKTEPYKVPIRRCERCHTVIEPYLSDQWFVRMKPLAVPAIEAVRRGHLQLIPERWVGVYLHWLENIRDWCISRQLWWGHRIPVWYCQENGHEIVAREDPTSCPQCGSKHLRQDEDVLDTWFSSWLWPFSTMGWPDDTQTLRRFYPSDVLVTAGDIIFFWVARMVMAGYEFMGECPFHTVFFNSVVRDLQGRKMSKSLGNSPDPIEVIDEYGADALRFTVVTSAPPGEDVRFGKEKTEFGRNFANKIWNAARFALRNAAEIPRPPAEQKLSLADRWILSRLERVTAESAQMLDEFRFNEGAMLLYRFIWGEFCDWYVELSKLALYGGDASAAEAARSNLVYGLERIMRLLHPYMPYVTEEIWQALPLEKPVKSVMVAPYPEADPSRFDLDAERKVEVLAELVRAVRNIRSELGLPPASEVQVRIRPASGADALAEIDGYFRALAKVGSVEILGANQRITGEPSAVVDGVGEVYVPLSGVVDLQEVRSRIERDLKKVEKELSAVGAKLSRPDFVEKAPADVVEKERHRSVQLEERRTTLTRHLETLSAAS